MSAASAGDERQQRDGPVQATPAPPPANPPHKRKRGDGEELLAPQPLPEPTASSMVTPAHVQRQPTAESVQPAPAARTPSLPTPPIAGGAEPPRRQAASGAAPGPSRGGAFHEDEVVGGAARVAGHPELYHGDEEFFGALQDGTAEHELAPGAAKERHLLRLLLHLKNGERPQYKSALKRLTEGAPEFGAQLMLGKMLPLLQSALLGEAQRARLVKVLDRVLFKLTDLLPSRRLLDSQARRQFVSGLDPRPWTVQAAELRIDRLISEGSCSKVYLADWHGHKVVVKKFKPSTGVRCAGHDSLPLDTKLARAEEEASLLALLRHPNVVTFLGLCPNLPAVVMEYCSRGSLHDVVRAAREDPAQAAALSWHRRLALALDMACGMSFLHGRPAPVVHRDLKSANCFVADDWRLKIGDLNFSKVLEHGEASSDGEAVTNARWLAPEVTRGGLATMAADVFSAGIVLWELLTWQLPWPDNQNHWGIASSTRGGERPPVPPLHELPGPPAASAPVLDAYVALMQRCWDQEPEARPTFPDVADELRKLLAEELHASKQPAVLPSGKQELEASASGVPDATQRVSDGEDVPARPSKRGRATFSP